MNVGFDMALKSFEFDYLMHIGDDDVFSSGLLDCYKEAIDKRSPYFGLKSLYFMDYATNRAMRFEYKQRCNKLVGCGRMFRRDALVRTGYQLRVNPLKNAQFMGIDLTEYKRIWLPEYQAVYLSHMKYVRIESELSFRLFESSQVKGLDNVSEMKMIFNNYLPEVIETDLPMITDVKSRTNIWKYDDFSNLGESVVFDDAMHFWSNEEKEYLKKLQTN